MTTAPGSSELDGGSDLATPAAPKPGGLLQGAARVLFGALLIVLGLLSPLMGLTMAMFSEGLDEPLRSSPMVVAYAGVGLGIACFIAAVGVSRGRRWGTIVGLVAVAILVVGGSKL